MQRTRLEQFFYDFSRNMEKRYQSKYDFASCSARADWAFGMVMPAIVHYANHGDAYIEQAMEKPSREDLRKWLDEEDKKDA